MLEELNGFTIRQNSTKSIDVLEGLENLLLYLKDKYAVTDEKEEIQEFLDRIEDAVNHPEEQEHGGEEVAYLTVEIEDYIFDTYQLIIATAPGDPTNLYIKYLND